MPGIDNSASPRMRSFLPGRRKQSIEQVPQNRQVEPCRPTTSAKDDTVVDDTIVDVLVCIAVMLPGDVTATLGTVTVTAMIALSV